MNSVRFGHIIGSLGSPRLYTCGLARKVAFWGAESPVSPIPAHTLVSKARHAAGIYGSAE